MYAFVQNSIRPSTAAAQCSLAELLDFGPAQTFVSHFWGSKIEDTLHALGKHCQQYKEGDRVRVWICSFANNQRRIVEELGGSVVDQATTVATQDHKLMASEKLATSSFSQALHSKYRSAVALMLDNDCQTLKRIWCLYEVLCVILMQEKGSPIRFDLCTPHGVLNKGSLETSSHMFSI